MANKKIPRKLPLKAIKEDYSKYKEVVEIEFREDDGNIYVVKLNPFFEPARINKMLQRFRDDLKQILEHKDLEFPDELIPSYLLMHCLMEFSDFPFPKTNDIKKKVAYFSQVINTKYFKEVTDHMIQEEFEKVWDRVMEIMIANEKIERMAKKLQKEVENHDFKSPEVHKFVQDILDKDG